MPADRPRAFIALSGGVDSAVAAAILARQGWDLTGIHLVLAELPPPAHLPDLARSLNLLLRHLDLRADFATEVIDYFTREYRQGRTPNPCVRCNQAIKFGRLWNLAREQGFAHLATGHYARLQQDETGQIGLYRAADRRKDQSYFLSRLPRELLAHLLFPLGDLTKEEVKDRFLTMGLPQPASWRESMELCFIPDGDYRRFIHSHPGTTGAHGDLVDAAGKFLGRHRGLEYYTVGQRRGLGTPAKEPYYVIDIRPDTNRVVLGFKSELFSSGLLAGHLNWLIDPPAQEFTATAVIRARHPGVAARITPLSSDSCRVLFATPQSAVAPGQAVAFYQEDRLLGGGWIEERIQ